MLDTNEGTDIDTDSNAADIVKDYDDDDAITITNLADVFLIDPGSRLFQN